ncbi:MAG TPA: Smr/MutS family protein [Polyangia bacterium]
MAGQFIDARALDWDEVTARLAAAAESPAGRALCLALPFAADVGEARRRMAAVAELAGLLRAGETFPSLAAPEVDAALASAEKTVALGAEELRPVAALARVAEAARRYLLAPAPVAIPEMVGLARDLDPPLGLARAIDETFDAAGEIRDTASPELERLRAERQTLQDRARTAIEELMRVEEYASVMQDQFFTIRAERYVLPLKASAKSLGLGIVHDTSRTGETVFVEPTALVAVNNRLKVTELDIRRESRRILEQLTADVAAVAEPLRRTVVTLAAIDARAAAARLAVAYDGSPIEIVEAPVVDLRTARHPLLALSHPAASVVANDVALGGGQPPILVVSGPNAGGKTVLMKTVGLAALMARAGLLVAADPRSRIGFFDDVRADIGDRQSVMGDLSTFSGHLAAVGDILGAREGAGAGGATMVLLDELMAGTNPDQGAALARATAETLAARPGLAIITTHYDSLKALGESDARFANAAMAYDLEALRPTFRLATGAPGRSYAFDIAARMGLPAALLERARALAGDSSLGLESVIARLQARESELVKQGERLAEAEAAALAAAETQREAAAALAVREREIGLKARDAVDAAVAETRAALAQIVREAQQARDPRAAAAGRAELERVAAEALARLPAPPKAAAEALPLAAGARVFVARLNADGVVIDPPDGRGRARVSVGALTIEVTADELAPPKTTAREAARGAGRGKPQRQASPGEAAPPSDDLALISATPKRTIDVRGQNGDEALAAIDAYLDRAALVGETHVVVVHGHGTGALRKRVRAHLDDSPYVARWAPGTARQGGDGASVIELR